jgi:hypothetical protein
MQQDAAMASMIHYKGASISVPDKESASWILCVLMETSSKYILHVLQRASLLLRHTENKYIFFNVIT